MSDADLKELSKAIRDMLAQLNGVQIGGLALRAQVNRLLGTIYSEDHFLLALTRLKEADPTVQERSRGTKSFFRIQHPRDLERDAYPGVKDYLETVWLPEALHGLHDIKRKHVEIVAERRKSDNRPNPDLFAILISSDGLTRSTHVFSFEVKLKNASPLVTATQTGDQARYVHYAYAVQQIESGASNTDDMVKACQERNIGLITFEDGSNPGSFRQQVRAPRNEHPNDLPSFVKDRLSEEPYEKYFGEGDDER